MLAALIGLALAVSRRTSASTRFVVWWLALAAVASRPVLILVDRLRPAPERVSQRIEVVAQTAPLPSQLGTALSTPYRAMTVEEWAPVPRTSRVLPWRPLAIFPAFWICGTLLMMARLAWSFVHTIRLRRGARLLSSSPVAVYASLDVPGPMALGFFHPVILVPEGLDEQLSESQFEQVVLHERAHIERRDQWTNLAERVLEAVYFFHPAVLWIGRRLRFEREVACDDWVVAQTGQASPYAECLTRLAAFARLRRGPALSTAAAGSRRQISRRIEMLLDHTRNRGTQFSRLALSVVAVMLTIAVIEFTRTPALVAIAQDAPLREVPLKHPRPLEHPQPLVEPVLLAQNRGRNTNFQMSQSNFWNSFNLKSRGVIVFTDDDRDVKSVSSDGSLAVEERRGLTFRKLTFTAGRGGTVERSYFINGVSQSFEPDGRAWMVDILPKIIRETAVGAPARVERILRQRGPAAVLDEVALMESDYAKRIYLDELIHRVDDPEMLRRVAHSIAQRVNSDGEKADLLISAGPVFLSKPELAGDYFRAVGSMNSDGEHRRVLAELLTHGQTGGPVLALVLQSVARMNSDGEKAWVLVHAARYYTDDEAVRSAYFKAAGTINSDGERRRVLGALFERRNLSKDTLVRALDAAGKMSSDGERAWVLSQAAPEALADAAVRQAYFRAVAGLNSDGERRRVLSTVVQHSSDTAALAKVLQSAAQMNSDGEKAAVLVSVSARYMPDAVLRGAFFDAARTINSDGERRRVLTELLKRNRTDKETLLAIIKSAAEISSDGEKGNILAELAKDCPDDDTLIAALVDAAQTINSDGEYRRVITPLVKKGRKVTIRKI